MISATEYIQLKAYARQDGFFMGLIWVMAFACYVGTMMHHPELQFGFIFGLMSTPFVAFFMLRNFRDKVLNGVISYKRAFVFTTLTLMYGSMIIAAAIFVYFRFLDNGLFFGVLMENIKLPEIQKSFTDAGMDPKDLESQLQMISKLRPIDFAFNVFFEAVLGSVVLSALLAVLGTRKRIKIVR